MMKENEQPDFKRVSFESNIFPSKETACYMIALVSRDEKGDRKFS